MKKHTLIVLVLLVLVSVAFFCVKMFFGNTGTDDTGEKDNDETVIVNENSKNKKVLANYVDGRLVLTDEAFSLYAENEDGTVCISLTKTLKEPFEIDIPETYNGRKVTEFIGISDNDYVEKIVFPDDVTFCYIYNCNNLIEVDLGKLTTPELKDEEIDISSVPFYGPIGECDKLETIVIPEPEGSGIHISDFSALPSLKNIELPEKTLALGNIDFHNVEEMKLPEKCLALICAFSGTEGLKKVECDEKLQSIEGSFWYMQELEEVVIPSAETEITNSFKECPNLTLVVQEGSLAEEYARENGIAYRYITED